MYRGISGNEYDKYVERFDNRSTLSKLQQSFWEKKQIFLQKIAKREDDCVISYDAELDAKLELFKSIAETCQRLLCVIDGYQDRICILAHEESCFGRFLKDCGRANKHLVAKMLTASGKTFYYSAQQRIQLRNPLINLYQNLETFQFKAISDTLTTIEQMEGQRTAYRASLLWMKSLSAKLDPDSYPELEKFRKVQNHVRKTKQKYDKKKIDCIQKVDMLNASRCNMLSQTLAAYQTAWLAFWSNTAFTVASISNCFEGCQVNEINEIPSLERANSQRTDQGDRSDLIGQIDEQSKNGEADLLLLDDGEEAKESAPTSSKDAGNESLTARQQKEHQLEKEIDLIHIDDSLDLDLFSDGPNSLLGGQSKNSQEQQMRKKQVDDLLTSSANSEDLILLDDILKWSSSESSFANSLSSVGQSFGDQLGSFSFTRNDEPSKLFGFSSKAKQSDAPDEQQTNKNQSKSEVEKKKWADLFADIDVFAKNGKKGDC